MTRHPPADPVFDPGKTAEWGLSPSVGGGASNERALILGSVRRSWAGLRGSSSGLRTRGRRLRSTDRRCYGSVTAAFETTVLL